MRAIAFTSLVLDTIQRLLNLVLTLLMLACLLLFAGEFVHAAWFTRLWPVVQVHRFGDPFVARFTGWLHMSHARPYVPLAMAVIVYVAIFVSDQIFGFIHRTLHVMRAQPVRKPQAAATPTGVESEENREQLYKEYRKIEKALKEAKRKRCSFLSVDVVGSTSMKSGETEIAITSTFRAYEEMLKRTFRATHAWKESWTPDGVMICFLNREDAVEAAKTILQKLLTFNDGDNALKSRFEVRCGVNEGDVVVFEDSDLEKLVEHTIDVAGHMQKYAKPGTLWLSKDVYDVLEDQAGFVPTGQEVDGYATYQWTPTQVEKQTASAIEG